MPTLVTDEGLIVTQFPRQTVAVSDTLIDPEWEIIPHLYCDKLTMACNAYDDAELSYLLGELVQPGTAYYDDYQPLSLLGKYVRIVITPPDDPGGGITWYGVVVGSANQRSAVKGDPTTNKLMGRTQVLRAAGLEYFLGRSQIDSARVYSTPTMIHIQRPLTFNGGTGVTLDADTKQRANRNPTKIGDFYQFVGSGQTPELWTTEQIVEYILWYHSTQNSTGLQSPVDFVLHQDDIDANVLKGIAPTLEVEGLTAFEVLNRLLAPQRGFLWWTEYDDERARVSVRVETVATSAITLPALGTIPANRDQQTLDFDRERDIDDVVLAENGSREYDQIIVRGARMTTTCTLGKTDSTLGDDWTSTIETAYLDAADATSGYGGLSSGDKAKRNDAFRAAEKFYRVFSAFRIPAAWDGKTGDGGAASKNWAIPELSSTGSVLGGLEIHTEGIRLLNTTRLKRGWDYSNMSSIVETTPSGSEAEYMPPFAIFKVATSSDRFQFAHKMNESDFAQGTAVSSKIDVGYDLHMQQTGPGFVLRAHGFRHAAALNHWSGAEPSQYEPQVDYDAMRATVTIEADAYCEARYPDDDDLPSGKPLQKLVIYVGDEYRLDYLPANTVVALDNGSPVVTNGGVLRDDRKRLGDIARVAWEWYSADRYPMTAVFRQVRNIFRLGMMITEIGEGTTAETINTVVSSLTLDLKNAGTMTVQTHDTDLDLVKLT